MSAPPSRVPLLFCIDVEPDDHFFPLSDPSPWRGFELMVPWLEALRGRLTDVTGEAVRFSWFLRMDPQVVQAYGSPTYAVDAYPGLFERLMTRGDALGVHPHMGRWDALSQRWIVDHESESWVEECVQTSVEGYRAAFGILPAQQRFGAGWWNRSAMALLQRLGTRFDLTAEPGEVYGTPLSSTEVLWLGRFPDFRNVPQRPYHPSQSDPARPVEGSPERLWEIPLTSGKRVAPNTAVRSNAARLRHPVRTVRNAVRRGRRAASGEATPRRTLDLMAMWQAWKSPEDFWRSVERRLSALEFPYLAFATRSDVPVNRRHYERVRGILEHLLTDRMARRVVFTTPEDSLSRLGFRTVPETA